MTIYAFLVNRNRLTLPKKMADYIADCHNGVVPVFLDQASDYPPLLEYYEKTPHKVVRLKRNWGNCAVWYCGILDEMNLQGHFIVSDPDLQIDHIPKDWLNELENALDTYKDRWKAGFGLMRDDLPDTKIANLARGWQGYEWLHPVEGGRYYLASIDTTFCLCRTRKHDFGGVRTGAPYLARHIPWYYTCLEDIPEDERYYMSDLEEGKWTYYSWQIKEEYNLGRHENS